MTQIIAAEKNAIFYLRPSASSADKNKEVFE